MDLGGVGHDASVATENPGSPLTSDEVYRGWVINPETETEHIRQIDYANHLISDGSPLSDADIASRIAELTAASANGQNSAPRLPEHAGRIVTLPQERIDAIAQTDPQLAARVAAEGVYVNLSGRVDLRPYALDGTPDIDLSAGVPRYDLTTPEGRNDLLLEDRARADNVLRAVLGPQAAAALLATHSAHYPNGGRAMFLVPDALTAAVAQLAPAPSVTVEEAGTTSDTSTRITADADRLSLPSPDPKARNQSVPEYALPVDADGRPLPLFDGTPTREQVAQGELGDCGMLATIAAVVGHRPELLNRIIQPNADGTVDVVLHESTLPGDTTSATGREIRITVQPEVPKSQWKPQEAGYARQVEVGTSWASTLEKAIAALDRTWTQARHDQWQQDWQNYPGVTGDGSAAPLGYARLGAGSVPKHRAELLTQLTGQPAHNAVFDPTPGNEADTETILRDILAAGNPVLVSSRGKTAYPADIRNNLPHDLVAGHAYEVVGVENGMVRLHNPWNTQHPTPMTTRRFLDLMRSDFTFLGDPETTPADADATTGPGTPVDDGRRTDSSVPGSEFHGLGRPAADPQAVLAVAGTALPRLAQITGVASITEINRHYYEVRPHGAPPLRIRLRATPLSGATVARTVRDNDGNYTLTVSDRAAEATIARALAHEIAKLDAVHSATPAVPAGPLGGGPAGPINPAGLTPHDQGRLAEIRLMARQFAVADPAGRMALRSEMDALAEHLGLRSVDPDVAARLSLLPADIRTALDSFVTPAITSRYADHVAATPGTTDNERLRQADYASRLTGVTTDAEIAARLRELAEAAAHGQNSMPLLPQFAGRILTAPGWLVSSIAQTDPMLANRVAAEGVYVSLDGRIDLRPFALTSATVPAVDVSDGVPGYDLTTAQGRRALLMEDWARAATYLRTVVGDATAAAYLAVSSPHYDGGNRSMFLVPDALTMALAQMAPGPALPAAETVPTSDTPAQVRVVADKVTLPVMVPTAPHFNPPPNLAYGDPVSPHTGQHVPLFNGQPNRDQIVQGVLGDCGVLATIASVVGHRPYLLNRIFHPNADGSVDVVLHESTLPGLVTGATGRELRITVWPDVVVDTGSPADSVFANRNQAGVAWVSLIEKALAAVDRTWSDARRAQWQTQWESWRDWKDRTFAPNSAAPLGYARLDVGSNEQIRAELLTQLTGQPAHVATFDTAPGSEAATVAWLQQMLAAGNPVLVATKPADDLPSALPHGVSAGHAYELVEAGNGQVRLRNPWGGPFHPGWMPISQFHALYKPEFTYLAGQPIQPVNPAAPPVGDGSVTMSESRRPGSGIHRAPGQVLIDEQGFSFVYFAILNSDGTVEGLAVLETTSSGPRTARWTARSYARGLGGERPVTRAEAERIAAEVLGFTLPHEAALHSMLDG